MDVYGGIGSDVCVVGEFRVFGLIGNDCVIVAIIKVDLELAGVVHLR